VVVKFNPITEKRIMKVLREILRKESMMVGSDVLAGMASSSDGDVRNAINALQFYCLRIKRSGGSFVR